MHTRTGKWSLHAGNLQHFTAPFSSRTQAKVGPTPRSFTAVVFCHVKDKIGFTAQVGLQLRQSWKDDCSKADIPESVQTLRTHFFVRNVAIEVYGDGADIVVHADFVWWLVPRRCELVPWRNSQSFETNNVTCPSQWTSTLWRQIAWTLHNISVIPLQLKAVPSACLPDIVEVSPTAAADIAAPPNSLEGIKSPVGQRNIATCRLPAASILGILEQQFPCTLLWLVARCANIKLTYWQAMYVCKPGCLWIEGCCILSFHFIHKKVCIKNS